MKAYFCFLLMASSFTGSLAQQFEIGIIDYYGLSEPNAPGKNDVEQCLPFHEGDPFKADGTTAWKMPAQECLKKLRGVRQAAIDGVCCDEKGRAMIFVGISQRITGDDQPSFPGETRLPKEIMAANDTLESGMEKAIQEGQSGEDDSQGHALFHFPKAQAPQDLFTRYANTNLATVREVLHHSKYSKDREVACWIIPFRSNKAEILPDLIAAVRDPDEGVRNNAIRALGILDQYFKSKGINVSIDPSPFIELMNSISWTDRNKSANLLFSLTGERNPVLLTNLKKNALYPLADMARWRSHAHAYTGFMILGRIAGWTDEVTNQRSYEDRALWVDEMLKAIKQ